MTNKQKQSTTLKRWATVGRPRQTYDLQNTTQKTKDRSTWTILYTGGDPEALISIYLLGTLGSVYSLLSIVIGTTSSGISYNWKICTLKQVPYYYFVLSIRISMCDLLPLIYSYPIINCFLKHFVYFIDAVHIYCPGKRSFTRTWTSIYRKLQ